MNPNRRVYIILIRNRRETHSQRPPQEGGGHHRGADAPERRHHDHGTAAPCHRSHAPARPRLVVRRAPSPAVLAASTREGRFMRGEAELFAHLSSKSTLPARSRGAEFSFYRAIEFCKVPAICCKILALEDEKQLLFCGGSVPVQVLR